MRVHLIAVAAVAMLTASAQDASARRGPYHTFLNQLEEKIEDLASGGWTSRDVRELKRTIGNRPQGRYVQAFQPFVRMLRKAVKRLHSGGFISTEREVLQVLLTANPDPDKKSIMSGDHEVFIRAFVEMAEEMHVGGFTSSEREVLKMLARTAPSLKHPPRVYDRSYSTWNAAVQKLEKRLRSGGVTSTEREILRLAEALRPRRFEADPDISPPPTPPPDLDADDYAVGSPSVVRACQRVYRVAWHGQRPRRHRDKVIRLLLLKRTTELLELDEGSCRERWVADRVTRVVPVRGTGAFVVLREGGLALLVDKRGDVFRLKRNIVDCRSDRRRHFTLIRRRGREIEMKIEGPADPSGQPLSIGGTQRNAVRLYRPAWRQLSQ